MKPGAVGRHSRSTPRNASDAFVLTALVHCLVAMNLGIIVSCSEKTVIKNAATNRPSDESEAIPGLLAETTTEPGLPTVVRIRRAEVEVAADAFRRPVRIRVSEVGAEELSAEYSAVLSHEQQDSHAYVRVSMIDVETGLPVEDSNLNRQLGLVDLDIFKFRHVMETPPNRTLVKLMIATSVADQIFAETLTGTQLDLKEGDLDGKNLEKYLTLEAKLEKFNFIATAMSRSAQVIGTSKLNLKAGEEFKVFGSVLNSGLDFLLDETRITPIAVASNSISLLVPSQSPVGKRTLIVKELGEEIYRVDLTIKEGGTGTGSGGGNEAGSGDGGGTGGGETTPPGYHRLFATDDLYSGDFGGMTFAHQKCREAAKLAFHSESGDRYYKTYRALLSVVGMGARQITIGQAGWSVKNTSSSGAETLAVSLIDLFGSGTGRGNFDIYTQSGQVPIGQVWTGSQLNGEPEASATCSNWTATSGSGKIGTAGLYPAIQYVSSTTIPCSSTASLYCVGGMPHFAFLTSNSHSAALGGLAGADAKCQEAANNGSVTGRLGLKWRALLSSSAVNANSTGRIHIQAPVYAIKADGNTVQIANGSADLWDGSIGNNVNIDEHGIDYYSGGTFFWTGTGVDGRAAILNGGDFCQDWTATSMSSVVNVGSTESLDTRWVSDSGNCSANRQLVCISVEDDL